MIRAAFLRRMAMAALACGLLDLRPLSGELVVAPAESVVCPVCNGHGEVLTAVESEYRGGFITTDGYLPEHVYFDPEERRVPCWGCNGGTPLHASRYVTLPEAA